MAQIYVDAHVYTPIDVSELGMEHETETKVIDEVGREVYCYVNVSEEVEVDDQHIVDAAIETAHYFSGDEVAMLLSEWLSDANPSDSDLQALWNRLDASEKRRLRMFGDLEALAQAKEGT